MDNLPRQKTVLISSVQPPSQSKKRQLINSETSIIYKIISGNKQMKLCIFTILSLVFCFGFSIYSEEQPLLQIQEPSSSVTKSMMEMADNPSVVAIDSDELTEETRKSRSRRNRWRFYLEIKTHNNCAWLLALSLYVFKLKQKFPIFSLFYQ